MTARFKADRAPAFLGTKFPKPGGDGRGALAMAINAAITERGLDRMVEVLLNDDYRRVDGAFEWSEYAEEIFMAAPGGDGPWLWDLVFNTTEVMTHKRKARGDRARTYCRSEFEWLPGFIISAVQAFDPHLVGWTSNGGFQALNDEGDPVMLKRNAKDTHRNAVLASDFEAYGPDRRLELVPRLVYASAEEAAWALIENLALLVTGEDVVMSVVNE